MLGLKPTRSLEVAHRVAGRINVGFELQADLTAGGIEIGLPAAFLFVVANNPSLLMQNPLSFSTNFVGVLGAGS